MLYILISFWLGGQFTRFYSSSISSDTVSGRFYKPQYGAMSFVIDTPLKQVITYSADTMIVYYPDRKKAFKIKSLQNIINQNRIATDLKEAIGLLRKSGYIFLRKEKKGDTIVSYWTHEKRKTTLKIVYDKKGRVFEVTVENAKGRTLYSTKVFEYITLRDSLFFPKKIASGTTQDTEVFVFDSVRIILQDSLPEIIKNPVLPESVSVAIKGFEEK